MRLRLATDLFRIWAQNRRERAVMWLAERVPKRLRYWVIVQECVRTAGPDRHPDSVRATEMLRRMEGSA